jgi:type II secretory pathway component PulM
MTRWRRLSGRSRLMLVGLGIGICLVGAFFLIERALPGRVRMYDQVSLLTKRLKAGGDVKYIAGTYLPANVASAQKATLGPVNVELPLRGQSLFDFHAKGQTITVPMESLQFIDDLSWVQAWSNEQPCGYPLPSYLHTLSRQRGHVVDPIQAFGLDRATLSAAPKLDRESLNIYTSAVQFILAHELGHVALKHRGDADDATTLAQERAADSFAMDVLGRAHQNPIGIFLVFVTENFFDPAEGPRRHPVSADRILAVAAEIKRNPAAYVEQHHIATDVPLALHAADMLTALAAHLKIANAVTAEIVRRGEDPAPILDKVFEARNFRGNCTG